MSLFKNPNDRNNAKINALIKLWLAHRIYWLKEYSVTITECQCTDVNCPHMETYIIIEESGNRHVLSVGKPLNYIRKWDIEMMLNRWKQN